MNSKFKFTTEIDIQISDINYGGHLGNDRYLSIFHEGRLRYLNHFGYTELSIGDDTSLIMSQAHIDFKAEAFWGDRLKLNVRVSKIKTVKFIIEYLIANSKDENNIIAAGYTEMVGFDYQNRKVKRLPSKFIKDIQEFERNLEIG